MWYMKVLYAVFAFSVHNACSKKELTLYQKVFVAALSSCKFSGFQKCCTEGDCAALSGSCFCNNQCSQENGGCCADAEQIGCSTSHNLQGCMPVTIKNGYCIKEGHSKPTRECSGGHNKVKCFGGHYLNGSRELTCQDGSWNLPIPNCVLTTSCSQYPTDKCGFCIGSSQDCQIKIAGEKFCYCSSNCWKYQCCEDLLYQGNNTALLQLACYCLVYDHYNMNCNKGAYYAKCCG